MVQNLYLIDPQLVTLETEVADIRQAPGGNALVALRQTIVRPAGGGQPADRASLVIDGCRHTITSMQKADGKTWLASPTLPAGLYRGAPVTCNINEVRRHRLTRCHSLIHLVMAALRWLIPGYESRGAEIDEDERTCRLWFAAEKFHPVDDLSKVDRYARSLVAQNLAITVTNVKSVDTAKSLYPHWRVDPALELIGKVRVIEIAGGIDANPCSGTHCSNTSEIGPYSLGPLQRRVDGTCFELIAVREETWQYWYGEGVGD